MQPMRILQKKFNPRRKRPALTYSVVLTLTALSGMTHAGTTVPFVTVKLQPGAMNREQAIDTLRVSLDEPLSAQRAGAPLLRLPLVISNVKTAADSLLDLRASDADGPLPLTFHDDADGSEPSRHWVAARAVHGPIRVSYRVAISNAPNPLGAAPPFELRSEAGVFSGLTGGFVLLPDNQENYRLQLHWNFDALGGSNVGVSTLGVGDRLSEMAEPAKKLESIFVMGGRLAHEPVRPADDGFFSAWQGTPPFDARALMQWTHRLYGYYQTFFRAGATPYSVYLRRNPINPGGGVEVGHSFVGTFDQYTAVDEFKLTLAHEMVHTFVGALDNPDELAAEWFAEGVAVYYQRLLPLRAGLIPQADYLRDLNATAARYYTDILNTTPNAQIPARFWPDTRVRVLPYDRGSLYFAQLNAQIVTQSHGQRSLDDLLLAFLQRRKAGQPLTEASWVQAVVAAVGERGRSDYEAMLRGQPIMLDAATFGPCFRRVQVPLRRYELGFTPDVLIQPKRIVRGLIPTSAAAKAGLRDGDEILKPVAQDGIQGDQHATLTLHIARGDKRMDITYLPRGETIPTYQWVASEAPDCRAR